MRTIKIVILFVIMVSTTGCAVRTPTEKKQINDVAQQAYDAVMDHDFNEQIRMGGVSGELGRIFKNTTNKENLAKCVKYAIIVDLNDSYGLIEMMGTTAGLEKIRNSCMVSVIREIKENNDLVRNLKTIQ